VNWGCSGIAGLPVNGARLVGFLSGGAALTSPPAVLHADWSAPETSKQFTSHLLAHCIIVQLPSPCHSFSSASLVQTSQGETRCKASNPPLPLRLAPRPLGEPSASTRASITASLAVTTSGQLRPLPCALRRVFDHPARLQTPSIPRI
jgi:hypothetical protein